MWLYYNLTSLFRSTLLHNVHQHTFVYAELSEVCGLDFDRSITPWIFLFFFFSHSAVLGIIVLLHNSIWAKPSYWLQNTLAYEISRLTQWQALLLQNKPNNQPSITVLDSLHEVYVLNVTLCIVATHLHFGGDFCCQTIHICSVFL